MSEFIDGDVITISSRATHITTYDNLFIRHKSNDPYRRDTAEKKKKGTKLYKRGGDLPEDEKA
jgi:hypothetical protein